MSEILTEIQQSVKSLKNFPYVSVTPTLAKKLLEMNTQNRPMSGPTLKHYVTQMKDGHWKFAGGTISISKTGRILDGQHRLEAIVQANTTQKFNIQTGLDDTTFDVFDTGRNRTGSDILGILGHKNSGAMASALKIIMAYDRKHLAKGKTLNKHERITNHDLATWTGDMELLKECIAFGSRCYSDSRLFAPATYAAFLYLFGRKNQEQAQFFFHSLVTGENISANKHSAIYYLRQKLINTAASRAKHPTEERYAWLIKTWNFYREDQNVKRITWTEDENFPKIK